MTKAECVCEKWFSRAYDCDFEEEKHDGSLYAVRVWKAEIEGVKFDLHCDNYYGRSILFDNGKRYADIEQRYDQMEDILNRLVALENFGRTL